MLLMDITDLIKALRQEASDVRSCFRTLSVQTIAFAVAATGALLAAMPKQPAAGLATVGVLAVVLGVQRLGIHKFNTANRLYGYQLYLERLPPDCDLKKIIGWEEALRAWRIVQATVFAKIYNAPRESGPLRARASAAWRTSRLEGKGFTGFLKQICQLILERALSSQLAADLWPGYFQLRTRPCLDSRAIAAVATGPKWYLPRTRVEDKKACYHAGSYLSRMLSILNFTGLISLIPLIFWLFLVKDKCIPQQSWRIIFEPWKCPSFVLPEVLLLICLVVWLLNICTLRNRA